MVRIINALGPIAAIRLNAQAMLQSLQYGRRATILSFLNGFVFITALSFVMYYTNMHDGPRVIWCYPISYACSVPVSLAFLVRPCWRLWKLSQEEDEQEGNGLESVDQPLAGYAGKFIDDGREDCSVEGATGTPEEI
jgi:hypothetical protein